MKDIHPSLRPLPDWRDLPENRTACDQPARTWLDLVAEDQQSDPDGFGRRLYWVLRDSLVADGLKPQQASRQALRAARIVVLLLLQYQQKEAAGLVSVSERTAKTDVQRVKHVYRGAHGRPYRGVSLPPVPRDPMDLVEVREPPASRLPLRRGCTDSRV